MSFSSAAVHFPGLPENAKVFLRGGLVQKESTLQGRRISIGPEDSSSRALSLKYLRRAGLQDQKSITLLSLTQTESAQKLIKGEVRTAIQRT